MTLKDVNFNYLLKYIIIGNSSVGKSCIMVKYIHGGFADEFKTTIGVEFGSKNISINDKIYKIQIWDTAGQETFRSITRAYYKNSVCACIVYDITNRKSFSDVKSWFDDCKKQTPKTVIMVLIGNKSDLSDKRVISIDEGRELAEKYNMIFFETSAKTGDNVDLIFFKSAEEIAKKIEQGYYDLENDCGIKQGINQSRQIQIGDNANHKPKNESGCC